jgi:hypothetical protein
MRYVLPELGVQECASRAIAIQHASRCIPSNILRMRKGTLRSTMPSGTNVPVPVDDALTTAVSSVGR